MSATPAPDPLDDKDLKRREKEARRLESENGPLEPAFRYKALLNAVEAGQDLIELADRKARFALVIISVLNAVALVLVVRGGDAIIPREGAWGAVLLVELTVYVAVTVYYIFQAIEALRPRGTTSSDAAGNTAASAARAALPARPTPGESARVLFHSDVVQRDPATYRGLWAELRMDNLNVELADQLHTVSRINQTKYAALARLYTGVQLMTGLLTLTLVTLGVYYITR
jgi:hypothetical protein